MVTLTEAQRAALAAIDWDQIDGQEDEDDRQPVQMRDASWRPPTPYRATAVPPQQ